MYSANLNCEGPNLACLGIGENECCGNRNSDYYSVYLSSTVSIDLTLRLILRSGLIWSYRVEYMKQALLQNVELLVIQVLAASTQASVHLCKEHKWSVQGK
jgi:hypothetical protein